MVSNDWRRKRRRDERIAKAAVGVLVMALVALCVAVDLVHAKLVYHDYRCAFAHCRIYKP